MEQVNLSSSAHTAQVDHDFFQEILKRFSRKIRVFRVVSGSIMISQNVGQHMNTLGRASSSMAKPNIHVGKIMLCIWWDQLGVVYYELLQPNKIITGEVF
ncbi:hypothetical protein LAZ67_2005035 [Cordylochernes scorpioides]|uniref:Transposase n=1 Tax=Cordylochernes scorpioides TaxID=51811 RepID=A0ABY6K7C3_9ARAC|nr:hypothetical protein LAZ67_2005035 [Cordylochernes scorpioides]